MSADGARNNNTQKQRRDNTRDGIQNNHRDRRGRPRDCASARGGRIPKRRGTTTSRHIGVYIRSRGGIDTGQLTQKQLRRGRIDDGKDVEIRDSRVVDGVVAMVRLQTVQDHGGGGPAG